MKAPPPVPQKPAPNKHKSKRRKRSTELSVARLPTSAKAIMRVMFLYVQNPGMSLQDVWGQGRMTDEPEAALIRDCVGMAAVARASAEDKWVQKRIAHWEAVKRRVLSEAQTDAVQRELAELDDLGATRDRLMRHILGDGDITAVKPKTLEGAVSALVAVDKRIGDKRRGVTEAIAASTGGGQTAPPPPGMGGPAPAPAIEDQLSDAEVAELAARMTRERAALPAPTTTEDDHGQE